MLHSIAAVLASSDRVGEAIPLFKQAILQQRFVLERQPDEPAAKDLLPQHYHSLADALLTTRRPSEAALAAIECAKLSPSNPSQLYKVACELAQCAELAAATGDAAQDNLTLRTKFVDQAIDFLGQAVRSGHNDRARMKADPKLQAIFDDPRFKTIVEGELRE